MNKINKLGCQNPNGHGIGRGFLKMIATKVSFPRVMSKNKRLKYDTI